MSLKTRRGPSLAASKAKQAAAGPKDDCEEGAEEPAYRRYVTAMIGISEKQKADEAADAR